ncbi:hypothetical protein VNI00_017605 [Paramarasmius palmivorus]|uniref:Uncharacterized protein n=1 Tax=Paramarasmius palmivorus TaxID=297713 RepID=A0AAW0B572_9AGAR
MSIRNSSKVSIRGKPTLNNVRGNQINHTKTIIANVVSEVTERDEYDEFEYVKRGHIVTIKDVHSEELRDWERVPQGDGFWVSGRLLRKTKRRICTVELHSDQSKFTAFIYEDNDARSFWEDDFRKFSRNRTTDSLQLFGLNRSEIPMLIELVPLAHFYKFSIWNDIFLMHLLSNKQSDEEHLWLDSTGTLCDGPPGPRRSRGDLTQPRGDPILVPSTKHMLEGDTSFRFFAEFGLQSLDGLILEWALRQFETCTSSNTIYPNLLPTMGVSSKEWRTEYPFLGDLWLGTDYEFSVDIIGGLCFDTIYHPTKGAVARLPQDHGPPKWGQGWDQSWNRLWMGAEEGDRAKEPEWFRSFLSWEFYIMNGLTRFKLASSKTFYIYIQGRTPEKFRRGWMLQVPKFGDTLRMAGNVDEEIFCFNALSVTVESPSLELIVSQTSRQYDGLAAFFRLCDGKKPPPIYLFLYPPPGCVSEVKQWLDGDIPSHFWSLDETGQSQMSEDECEEWGIPNLTPSPAKMPLCNIGPMLLYSPPHICEALRDWQTARGYDPSTADYARYMGYPEYEIVNEPWPGQAKTPESHQTEDQAEENEKGCVHKSTWWEAIPGSGISAFGF